MINHLDDFQPVPRIRQMVVEKPRNRPNSIHNSGYCHSMHLNELPFKPHQDVMVAMQNSLHFSQEYPDPNMELLTNKLSYITQMPRDQIIVGPGSNSLIAASADIALNPGDEVIGPDPNFPAHKKVTQMRGATYRGIPLLDNGRINIPDILRSISKTTKLIYISSPHNPTGTVLSTSDIRMLLDECPSHVLIHYDEAYYEFGIAAGHPETLPLLNQRRKPWIATRTFSKAYGLAALRVGYGFSNCVDVISCMKKCLPNYSVNSIALAGALAALSTTEYNSNNIMAINNERIWLSNELKKLEFDVLESSANFVAAKCHVPAILIANHLASNDVLVLPFRFGGPNGSLRISVGSRSSSEALLNSIKNFFRTISPLELASKELIQD